MRVGTRLVIWCGGSFVLGAVLTWCVLTFRVPWSDKGSSPTVPTRATAAGPVVNPEARTPPWGQLEAFPLPLGNSEEIFWDRSERLRKSSWFFENMNRRQLDELFKLSRLSRSQRSELQDPEIFRQLTNGVLILPPQDVIWTMRTETRAQIYSALAHCSSNYAQCYPFRFSLAGGLEERFGVTGIAPLALATIKRLVYTNAGALCLADLQVLPDVMPDTEFKQVIEALYRVPAFQLRLRVNPESDIDALVLYWGRGGREKLIRPLLESMAKLPGGASINISYLLPPSARNQLYTFPSSWANPQSREQDCVWTAMNFFKDPPDAHFLDPAFAREVLRTQYQSVTGKPVFGDIVALLDSAGNGIHLCVYLADDYVYTKNGLTYLQPWVIMKLSDTLACFPSEQEPHLAIFRLKSDLAKEAEALSKR